MKPLHYYFLGTGAWFLAYGIQSVAFAWLVTIVLAESPTMVGFAQMAFLLPAMLLMLVGGSLADQVGGRRMALIGHLLAAIAPLFLIATILLDQFTYTLLLVFAVIIGCSQAIVTPARDGLLAQVADGRIQQRVVQVSLIQFGIQMLGFVIAAFADTVGAVVILSLQSLFLFFGAVAFHRLQLPFEAPVRHSNKMLQQIAYSIVEGYHSVRQSPHMSAVVIQNCAMGMFFMGSYIVTIPLLIREVYSGSSVELSWVNGANSLGLVFTMFLLMRFGDIKRQGRALLISQMLGSIALLGGGLGLGFNSLILCIFGWGLCGGIAMTMSRTVMQEQAPENQRARMMSFYSFSFMGAGPIGALLCGFLVDLLGASMALIICPACMLIVSIYMSFRSPLWSLGKT
ncbi:MAG: MFS family permease [Candidatus Azotimanducaceae bacterium]|jgi:MFS family permease